MANDKSKIRIESNVLKGKEFVYNINCGHLGKLVLDKLGESEDFIGQIDAATSEKYSFKTIKDRSVRCALWMRSQGLDRGDVVVICSHNQSDNAITCFAALYVGAIFTPWDAGLNARDFGHLMKVCKPKMAFVSPSIAGQISEASKVLADELKIIILGDKVDEFYKIDDIIDEQSAEEVKTFEIKNTEVPDEIAMIICSSGTTGLPKGVSISHSVIPRILNPIMNQKFEGMMCMVYSSLHWLTGAFFMFFGVLAKVTNVLSPAFEEESACAYIEKYKINWILMAPNMVTRLTKFPRLRDYDFSLLRLVMAGGSPLSISSQKKFSDFLPNGVVTSFYGVTECGGTISNQSFAPKPGSCGHIVENVELKVVDPETGKLLGPKEEGEFLVKSPNMMISYYDNPEATKEAVDEQGFFHTGDIGYYDEDGEVFIVDRLKELIKYRNYHVSPSEIETLILSHPGVKEAVVVGLPHPEDGQHPTAFVVKSSDQSDPEKTLTETDLINFVAAELSQTKHLRGGVRFVDSLPKTPSDKVLRKLVREMARKTV